MNNKLPPFFTTGRKYAVISPDETMIKNQENASAIKRYFGVGISAIAAIQCILEKAHVTPTRILDIPCGFGRVLRILKAVYPTATIVHCDLNKKGVDFCTDTFGTLGIYSNEDINLVEFPAGIEFDLIWVGSLITHLPEKRTKEFISFCMERLSNNGVAVFTSHGEYVAEKIRSEGFEAGQRISLQALLAKNNNKEDLLSEYESKGYGHLNYPNKSDYGLSLISMDWFNKTSNDIGCEIVDIIERGWDMHHDVIGIRRKTTSV